MATYWHLLRDDWSLLVPALHMADPDPRSARASSMPGNILQIVTGQFCDLRRDNRGNLERGNLSMTPTAPINHHPPQNPRNKIDDLASSTGSACTLRMRDPIATTWWCHALHASRLQAASWRFGPHLEVGHLATEPISPGKIVLAGAAAVGAGPAGIIVTEVGVRVDSHASARVPKGQVVPTSPRRCVGRLNVDFRLPVLPVVDDLEGSWGQLEEPRFGGGAS
eukprot:CAMPEP_0181192282 /NCGR_PEP_ID=MMETSP1096-20121128/13200_1 /TAXON_ID=156174 ORGANISM="Chrysochromulina ericina, Strain CCMP281" /NCGR_SAMPLE_ID=MMETSP1096 /ASSEMBLY_ACC=CAM_ASM_000453 /LENGTH=222 /DNA_ID=CAMNT_0023281667 /DNA_START=292 /DNA_END=958 /DNA_ORIENTATION=-